MVLTSENAFLLIVLGMSGLFVVLLWMIYWIYRVKALEREERRLMIEKGMVPPPPQPVGWPAVRAREVELKYQDRRLRIESGLDVEPEPKKAAPTRADLLRRGVVAFCVGLGAALAYVALTVTPEQATPDTRYWLLGLAIVAPIVWLYGVAHLLYYRATKDVPRQPAA